jgi:hypothetical protein
VVFPDTEAALSSERRKTGEGGGDVSGIGDFDFARCLKRGDREGHRNAVITMAVDTASVENGPETTAPIESHSIGQ